MATYQEVMELIKTLPVVERQMLVTSLNQMIKPKEQIDYVANKRFSGGYVCPKCGCTHIVRNGHRADGKQRYLCRDCQSSFISTTESLSYYSTKDVDKWRKYVSCMMLGLSVRKTAQICNIHKNTAFRWRHKILDSLQGMADSVTLKGIIEADEKFFPVSYKGNHKNRTDFVMPRQAHHRGNDHEKEEEIQEDGTIKFVKKKNKRGLSEDKVCVPCAINREGLTIAKVAKLGKVSKEALEKTFENKIEEKSTICTDKEKSYREFSIEKKCDLVQLNGNQVKKGIYHIQHINSYHSILESFMYSFKGVSTKYLNNYLIWNNIVNHGDTNVKQRENDFFEYVITSKFTETNEELSKRPALPLLV